MAQYQTEEPTVAQMEELKVLVADELTKYASSMLLDPEYGLPATKALDPNAGLLLAYEKTGTISPSPNPSTYFTLTGTSTFKTSMLKRGSEKTFIAPITLCGFTFAYSAEPASAIFSS